MNLANKVEDQLQKDLTRTSFDVVIPSDWILRAKNAMRYASPLSLGLSGKDFKALLFSGPAKGHNSFTLYEFAVLSNNLERTSADQMHLEMTDYCRIIVQTNELTDKWNEIVNKMRGELMAKFVLEQQEIDKAAGKQPFKPLKAEA
jgi:hypothetical protein